MLSHRFTVATRKLSKSHHIKLPIFDQSLPSISHSMYHDYAPAPGDTRFSFFSLFCVLPYRNKQQHVPRACGSLAKITFCRNTHSHPLHIPPFTPLTHPHIP